jgi:hypothetical protein
MTRSAFTLLSSADPAQTDDPGRFRMRLTRLKTARSTVLPSTQLGRTQTCLSVRHPRRPILLGIDGVHASP